MKRAALWITRLDPTSAELVLAGAALAFGCALLVPVDLSIRSAAFRALVELLPQWGWACVWLTVGTAQAVGAATGYRRQAADVAAAALWLFWTVVQLIHLGLTVGPFSYGWLVMTAIVASHLDRRHGAS